MQRRTSTAKKTAIVIGALGIGTTVSGLPVIADVPLGAAEPINSVQNSQDGLKMPRILDGSIAPGESARLSDYDWVVAELARSDLTPDQRKFVSELPVSIGLNLTDSPTSESQPFSDPVMHVQANLKDIFGITVLTDD